jgi:hypothetical protein
MFLGASVRGALPNKICHSGQLEKKVAANRPGVPLPFPLYIEEPFLRELRSSQFSR